MRASSFASRDIRLVGEPHRYAVHDRDGVADCAGVGGGGAADAQVEALARRHYNGSLHAQPNVMQLVRGGKGLKSTAPTCSDLRQGWGGQAHDSKPRDGCHECKLHLSSQSRRVYLHAGHETVVASYTIKITCAVLVSVEVCVFVVVSSMPTVKEVVDWRAPPSNGGAPRLTCNASLASTGAAPSG